MFSTQKPVRRRLDGVLLLDKPAGLSSNDALIRAKRLLRALKAGHTGTLDPFATGLLPLCFGEATKFSQDLLEADKTYETVVHLGVRTTTGDTEGDILETRPADMGLAEIEAVLPKFRGALQQLPPMHSALKKDGKPLYEYARAGITLERELRAITIHRLELLGFDAPFLRLRVTCSKGTYIRVLGEDIGAVLGCGAHLRELRRTGVGDLCIDDSLTLEQLDAYEESQRASLLAPVDTLLASFPPVQLSPDATRRFLHGQRLALGKESISHPPSPGRVRVYEETSQRLLGTAMFEEYGVLRPERLIAAMD